MINHKNFKIIAISKDEIGRYLKLEVQLPDGTTLIRWELDAFTYHEIKKLVSKNFFDSLARDYYFEILPYAMVYNKKTDEHPIFHGYIRCVQGNRAARIEFKCSQKFAGNVEWFRKNVRSVEDVEHLIWGNGN